MRLYRKERTPVGVGTLLCWAVAILLAGCEFKDPKAPRWDAQLNIPLVNKTYTMADLADESKHLFISGDDSLLGLRIDGSLDTVKIGSSLTIDDFEGRAGVQVGEFTLGNLGDPQVDEFGFDEVWPPATPSQAPVPAFDIPDGVVSNLNYDASFRFARIFNGVADVTVENALPVDFQNLSLTLYGCDVLTGIDTVIGVIEIPEGIVSGGGICKQMDLAGKNIPSLMYWEISGHSEGSGGQVVDIDPADVIRLETVIASLTVRAAHAKIPSIDFSKEQTIEMPEDVILYEARFLSGGVRIEVDNNTDLGAKVQLTFPDLRSVIDGIVYSDSLDMGPRTNDSLIIPLRHYMMSPEVPPPGENQQLKVQIEGFTESSGENFITVMRDDSVSIALAFVNLHLAYARGVLDAQEIAIDTVETALDLPEGLKSFKFSRALLVLDLLSTIGLPMRFDGLFLGSRSDGLQVAMPLNFNIQPGAPGSPARTLVPFNQDNSNIVELLNMVPDKLLFTGTATFGDGQTTAQLTALDYFLGHFMFSTPFEFAWGADTVRFDTVKFIITPENADDSLKDQAKARAEKEGAEVLEGDYMTSLKSAHITTTITTRLPIGMELVFKFSEDSSKLFESPDVIAGPLKIPQGPPVASGPPVTLTSELGLDESEVEVFQNSGNYLKRLFFAAELIIAGTNGEVVQIFASDFITVESTAVVVVHVEDDRQ